MPPEPSNEAGRSGEQRNLSPPVSRAVLALWARDGKWAELSLSGVSMAPLIPDGSRLTVRFGRLGLARGDVVLYAREPRLIAHRVVRLGRRGKRWGFVKVKGDPVRPGEAAWVAAEDILGRVVAVRRPDGTAVLLNTIAGRMRGRIAATISSSVGWAEARARSRLGFGGKLTLAPALLRLLDPLGRVGIQAHRREAGFLLRPEERFLISAAVLNMTQDGHRKLQRSLSQEVPWERVLAAASALGLSPLLYRNLARPEHARRIPEGVVATLARSAHASACQMAIQISAIEKIVKAMRADGIDPVLLKGAALVLTLYEQPALRSMQDIDLLVEDGNLESALSVLERLGFKAIVAERGAIFYATHHHATPMIGMGGRVIVEIHRGLVPPESGLSLDPAPFLARAVRAESRGFDYLVLSREDQVLHACLHISYCDRFVGKLRDLMDIHSLVEAAGGRLDWGRLLDGAGRQDVARCVYSTLDLSRRLLGTSLPAEAMNEMARAAAWDPLAEGLVRALARASLFSGGPSDSLLPTASARFLCGTLLRRARWSSRVRALVQMLGEA